MDDCEHVGTTREGAQGLRVRDVMRPRPKTLPATAAVADLNELFANPHVVTALLVDDDGVFAGSVDRTALPEGAVSDEPALAYATAEPQTIAPDAPVARALEQMDGARTRRLVVVDDDTRVLRGLLCLTTSRESFCL